MEAFREANLRYENTALCRESKRRETAEDALEWAIKQIVQNCAGCKLWKTSRCHDRKQGYKYDPGPDDWCAGYKGRKQ